MIFQHSNYREYLRATLLERVKGNPAYSLRAMAKQIGFSSSQLSEAMSGKANFSSTSLRKIASKFNLNSDETEYLCLLGELETQKEPEVRELVLQRLRKLNPQERTIHDLSVDHFKQISEWYHSAILELVYIKGFQFTAENIAKKLDISKLEAEVAIDRLTRLELLTKNEDGTFSRQGEDFQVKSPEKNAAMRKFYRQIFEKASVALEEQNPTERWSGYETIPVAVEALPELREACDAFFEEVVQISKKYPNKKNVYHLLVHFFNLTHERK